jgi:dephospho-CoA kinase
MKKTVAMLKVGLTGGIACGKSTVLEMFAARGAHVLRADLVAHQLMEPGQKLFAQVVAKFGREILDPDGRIDRARLAARAFPMRGLPGRIQELNAIMHPAVFAYEDDWMRDIGEADPGAVTLCEAALMIEAGGHHRYDRLIVVTCTEEQRVERFAQRSGLSLDAARAEVNRRMAAQMPEQEKVRLADYVIDNSGTREELAAQVDRIWQELHALAVEPH